MANNYKTLDGISIISGFALNSPAPMDSRTIVSNLAELDPDYIYTGLVVYVNSDDDKKGLYVYTGENWKPVATSTTVGDIEIPSLENYYTKTEVDEAIENIDIPEVDLSGYSKIDHTHAYKPSFSKSIYHGAGNPQLINFITVDYSTYTSGYAAYFKLDATSCHGNGVSYQFLEEIIIGVTATGDVSLAINKSCQQACGQVDGIERYFGDVFAVKDETNKKVYFYILGGQYCHSWYTDLTPIGSATTAGVTQHTSLISYSSGTKQWAQGCGNTCHDYLPLSGGTVEGNITANSISANSISSEVLKGVIFKSDDTAAALKFSDNNEINFGSNGDTLFLGYDATRISADNGAVGNYRFGNSTGSAGMMAGKIYCGEVYVNNGTDKVITQADLESEVLTITNNNPTLSWSSTSTIGTIGGVSLTVTMPSNPNTDTDTKVKQTSLSSGTTDYYLLASSTSSPTSGTAYEAKYNTSVKLNGNGQLTAATFYATSDARKKENIKEFIPQKSILDLPIVEFDFKDSGLHQIGCLAQDLQKICPEIVNTDQDGYLSINESKIVYLLLDEIKKLKKEIDAIKGK